MFPPSQGLSLDIEALSGICGSVSIACWIVVFSPQIIENFQRGSAEGLSIVFLVVWLAGDVFNILGAVLQGVLPTMVILAVYYTLADIVLLAQCFYYRGFTLSDAPTKPAPTSAPSETSPLVNGDSSNAERPPPPHRSSSTAVSSTHLSPATPLHDAPTGAQPPASALLTPTTPLQTLIFNTTSVLLVVLSGVFGWYLSTPRRQGTSPAPPPPSSPSEPSPLRFSPLGQVFGYLCALFYLGSRIPQILLNHRRKSTEGVSLLFFLFACIGNLTYVLSIFAYESSCRHAGRGPAAHDDDACRPGEPLREYALYLAVNASWLLGSFGTLLLDLGIFAQFFWYRRPRPRSEVESEGEVAVQD
ncbi:MAG: hypothetical protein M1833_001820 [Piccolia ochrophora]|nr:MAG: hypothetical protein M1833_001820 [Piccolia ochrophora]